jgi:uncharacterized protein
MLTAEFVVVRRRGNELSLPAITGKSRADLETLAEQAISGARLLLGRPRSEWDAFVLGLGETSQQKKLARGLGRLLEQTCTFEIPPDGDAELLRTAVFDAAAIGWQSLPPGARFERDVVLREAAGQVGLELSNVERTLFADLPFAQILLEVPEITPSGLVDVYDQSRVQAVLLRAVEVRVVVPFHSGDPIRHLFQCLKFRRLMFETERLGKDQLRLTINGPFSLFESVAKYGLELALLWPALLSLGNVQLEADVQWGRARENQLFRYDSPRSKVGQVGGAPAPDMRSELVELSERIGKLDVPFTVRPATVLLEVKGLGVCVPDLTFEAADGRCVHLELMGYWSRQSVWKRIDLARAGLAEPVLFACSSRLRVSEDTLSEDDSGRLLVYRGQLSPRAVARAISTLFERSAHPGGG